MNFKSLLKGQALPYVLSEALYFYNQKHGKRSSIRTSDKACLKFKWILVNPDHELRHFLPCF